MNVKRFWICWNTLRLMKIAEMDKDVYIYMICIFILQLYLYIFIYIYSAYVEFWSHILYMYIYSNILIYI